MANKKTVVEMFKEILPLCVNDEQRAFINKRIEITEKKNANRGNGELTPKQKEKMAETEGYKSAIVGVMVEGATYTPSDLVKLMNTPNIPNTQKITPMLTKLVEENRLTKATVKGRSVYSLPSVAEVAEG